MKGREGRRGGGQTGTEGEREEKKKKRKTEMGTERSGNRNELGLYYTRLDIAQEHFLWYKMSVSLLSVSRFISDLKLSR